MTDQNALQGFADHSYRVSALQEHGVLQERDIRAEGRRQHDQVQLVLRFDGPVDHEALNRSLTTIVGRHQPLRTIFPNQCDPPMAVVTPPQTSYLVVAEAESAAPELDEILGLGHQDSIDIQSGPTACFDLVVVTEVESYLIISIDHLAADGVASLRLIAAELESCYRAEVTGRRAALPALAVSYGDFATAHRRRLGPENRRRLVAEWRGRLPPDVPEPSLALAPRPGATGDELGAAEVEVVELPRSLDDRLRDIRGSYRVTNFQLFMAALLGAQQTIAGGDGVGAMFPVDIRSPYGAENLVGRFSDLSVIWIEPPPDTTAEQLLTEVRARILRSHALADLPLGEIVRTYYPQAYGRSRFPPYLFFSVRQPDLREWTAGALRVAPVDLAQRSRIHLHPGLKVSLVTNQGLARLECQYATAAYPADGVRRLLTLAVEYVRRLADRPDSLTGQLGTA
ncbi:condensation domain-containing protein [Kribbella sancticallisti]|uniref:condensation domain-containing protein n=1 Tax=Kribbella sancticallisti TaxID=460087 RepID=UPI0031D7697A